MYFSSGSSRCEAAKLSKLRGVVTSSTLEGTSATTLSSTSSILESASATLSSPETCRMSVVYWLMLFQMS